MIRNKNPTHPHKNCLQWFYRYYLQWGQFLFKAAHIIFKHTNVSVQDNNDVLLIHSVLCVIWNWRLKYVEDDTLFLRLLFGSVWASSTAEAENVPKEMHKKLMRVWMCDLQTSFSSSYQVFSFFSKQNKYFSHWRSVHVEVWDHTQSAG